jgi:CubicO group peptidase (beta-lactamase class C family)
MTRSTFDTASAGHDRATPYDAALRRLPHYRFAAAGAAGLYATAADLARLAVAGLRSDAGGGLLRASTVAAMETLEDTGASDGFGHGLGYAVVPHPGGGRMVGHTGSNEGWTSSLSLIPESGDALVVLVNRSDAFPVYRDLLCDWVEAARGARWAAFCERRAVSFAPADEVFVDQLLASTTPRDPAAAVLVATTSGVVYRKAFGARSLGEAAPAAPETPFYTASLAKSLTAAVALDFAARGTWSLDDPIGRFVPDLPEYVRAVTIDQLLSHTAGVPNYHGLIDWSRYDGMDNRKAIALLATRPALDFPPGTRYGYSNTGYLLVASAIEALAGRPYGDVLKAAVLDPLGMRSTVVDDGRQPPPGTRALGYQQDGGKTVLSDYHTVTIGGQELPLRSSTVGAGGMYSTLDDLYAFERSLRGDRLVPLPLAVMAQAPRTLVAAELEVPGVVGHGYGWFLSRWRNRNVVWNSGDFAGHHTAILRVPEQELAVIVLACSAERSAIDLARTIAERLLASAEGRP